MEKLAHSKEPRLPAFKAGDRLRNKEGNCHIIFDHYLHAYCNRRSTEECKCKSNGTVIIALDSHSYCIFGSFLDSNGHTYTGIIWEKE